jgi:hypothetical protein
MSPEPIHPTAARKALILAALKRETLPFGSLYPDEPGLARLPHFGRDIYDRVAESCIALGEPDLTWLLVRADGTNNHYTGTPEQQERVWDYWRQHV